MDYKDFTKNKYFIIVYQYDVLSHGEVKVSQTLTTSHNCEFYNTYNEYADRLRQFGIHVNLE